MAAPGLDEITTTTARNRKMDKGKPALKTAQTGTPVPAKDFSSSKKESKAAGNGKSEKGSAATAKALPIPTVSITPVSSEPKKWEGSTDDWKADYSASKRKGISTADYEDSASDRVSDAAGERRMKADDQPDGPASSSHKPGTPAFANTPKASHGYGHPSSARDGHLRNSGHSSAHRIGKKK